MDTNTNTATPPSSITENTATPPEAKPITYTRMAAPSEAKPITYTQAELDEKIKAALAKQKADFEKEKSEAEKLAKMDKEAKEAYKEEQRRKALDEREKAVALRELKQTAIGLLVEKKLDPALADILNYESAETVKASIDKVETVLKGAIETGINVRIKASGGTPRQGSDSGATTPANMSDDDFKKYIDKIKAGR